jgi:hypothetical protein
VASGLPAAPRTWAATRPTALDALHACNAVELARLQKRSSRAHRTRLVVGPEQAERLRVLAQRRPRTSATPTSLWTLALTAEVNVAAGIVSTRVRGETFRQKLLRLGISWERAKHWITSPDPA